MGFNLAIIKLATAGQSVLDIDPGGLRRPLFQRLQKIHGSAIFAMKQSQRYVGSAYSCKHICLARVSENSLARVSENHSDWTQHFDVRTFAPGQLHKAPRPERSIRSPSWSSTGARQCLKMRIGLEGAHGFYVSIFGGVSTFAISRLSVLTLKYRILPHPVDPALGARSHLRCRYWSRRSCNILL